MYASCIPYHNLPENASPKTPNQHIYQYILHIPNYNKKVLSKTQTGHHAANRIRTCTPTRPTNGLAIRCNTNYAYSGKTGIAGFEPTSPVLKTGMLPLHHTPETPKEGFEPPWNKLSPERFSRPPRYDHFAISAKQKKNGRYQRILPLSIRSTQSWH